MSARAASLTRTTAAAYLVPGAVALVALAVWPWGHNPFGPVKLVATFVAASLACGLLAMVPGTRTRLERSLRSPVARAAFVLAAVYVLSLVTSVDLRLSVAGGYPGYLGLAAGLAWLAIGLTAMSLPPAAMRVGSGRVGTAALGAVAVYAVLQRLGIEAIRLDGQLDLDRVGSLLGNAANLGVFIALALPLVLDRALAEESVGWRRAAMGVVGLASLASAFSGSRGGWAGLLAGACVWFIISGMRRIDRRRIVLAGLVVLALVIGIAVTPSSASRLTGGGTASATTRGRLAVWSATAPLLIERPVLGWGVAAFGRVFPQYATPSTVDPTGRTELLDDPHNLVLSVAASAGAVGTLALVFVIGACVIATRRGAASGSIEWSGVLAGGLAGALTALQFHFVTLETGALAALLLGCLAAAGEHDPAPSDFRVRFAWIPATVMCVLCLLAVGLVVADTGVRAGFAAAGRGDTAAAIAAFDRAAGFAPWEPAIGWAKGRALIGPVAAGDTDAFNEGVDALTRASARMPRDARPVRDLGDMYVAAATSGIDRSSVTGALDAYHSAIGLAPLDPRARLGSGVAFLLAGDLSSAERDILRSVERAPRFADAWENLAAVYDAMGDPGRAAAARRAAAEARR